MKTKSKWVINLMYALLHVAWSINIILAVVAFCMLTLVFTTKTYTDINIPAKFKTNRTSIALQSAVAPNQVVIAETDQAIIKIHARITTGLIIEAYAFFIMIEALIILILYHLRKIFRILKTQQPFQPDIVQRLRIVAVCLVLSTPLRILIGVADYFTVTSHVKDFNDRFMIVWSDSLTGVILGLVLYVIAEVFRYGIELKNENEAFV